MINLTDNFYVVPYQYGWTLIEKYEGKDKDDNPVERERELYYPSLRLACNAAVDKSMKSCLLATEILAKLDRVEANILEAVKNVG